MDNVLLPQAIARLGHHAEVNRIKKLIYWVCEHDWPRSAEGLEDLGDLLPRLLVMAESKAECFASTPTVLRTILLKGVSGLSKPERYTEIALVLCNTLAPLYADQNGTSAGQKSPDLFELRLAVMKYTVPVHAKILIYSALEQGFTGKRRDWMALRQVSLDDLLLRLCQTFTTFYALEERLRQTVEDLQVLDQPAQVMEAVLQAVRPFYQQDSKSVAPIAPTETSASQPMVGSQVGAAQMTLLL
jgi:hypothetical protein